MIILHNRQSAESRAFVASCSSGGHTIIDWYVDQAAVADYLVSHPGLYPSAFPSVVIRRPDVEVPEATDADTGETIPAHVEPAHWELVRCPSSLAELADLHDAYYGLTLAEAKAEKLTEIWEKSAAAMSSIRARYSQPEQDSWPAQERDARALLADPDAPAVVLRGIATAAGRDLMELRDKVLANVAAAELVTGQIIGQQQAFERRLSAILVGEGMTEEQAVADVQAITVSYSLLEGV